MPPPGAYFVEDQPELKLRLDQFFASLREDLRRQPFHGQVAAFLLAGGYGRGEGGVFRAVEEGAPAALYNDLEFYLLLQPGADHAAAAHWTEGWSHRGDEALGIEVEFKLLAEEAFRSAEPSMFYYDLLAAHRMVEGPEEYAAQMPARLLDPALIPAHEATRLLFNRGSGLFFSLVALERGEQADARVRNGFIERNHAKVRLALGDAVLAMNGRYHYSCVERDRRLEKEHLAHTPPDLETIRAWHREGVEFKLRPRHRGFAGEELRALQAKLGAVWMRTFLWVESRRLGREFAQAAAYGETPARLFPHVPIWKAVAVHVRDRLKRQAALPGWSDYPRAALQRALVLLLQPIPDAAAAARRLGSAATLEAVHATYERWWRIYN